MADDRWPDGFSGHWPYAISHDPLKGVAFCRTWATNESAANSRPIRTTPTGSPNASFHSGCQPASPPECGNRGIAHSREWSLLQTRIEWRHSCAVASQATRNDLARSASLIVFRSAGDSAGRSSSGCVSRSESDRTLPQRGTMLHRKSQTTSLPSRQFVTPTVFEHRLTSRSRLVRADDHAANAIGLLDQETGEHILVNRSEWLKHNESPRETAVPA